jgi:ketosteroid isomerase-like protein
MADHAQTIRELYAALDGGDVDRVLELSGPEPVVEDPDMPGGGSFHGAEEVRGFLHGWLEAWDEYSIRVEEVVEVDDTAVALLHQRGRGKGSDVPTELRDAHVWTFREGVPVHCRTYLDRAEALAAAGAAGSSAAP